MNKKESLMNDMKFISVEDDLKALEYADLLLEGYPVCFDFENCPITQAQTVVTFLSGVNYATDGMYKRIKQKVYLFGLKEHFKDPDIKRFIEKYSE